MKMAVAITALFPIGKIARLKAGKNLQETGLVSLVLHKFKSFIVDSFNLSQARNYRGGLDPSPF